MEEFLPLAMKQKARRYPQDFPGGWASDKHNAFTPKEELKSKRDMGLYLKNSELAKTDTAVP
jgi:hypothetical protein